MDCKCAIQCSVTEISIEKDEDVQEIKAEQTTFDFGTTTVGGKVRKMFTVRNHTNDELEYTVYRDPISNPIYHCFDFHYTPIVSKNSNFKCVIWFKPNIAPWFNVHNIHIEDNTGKCYKLTLKGHSAGPTVQLSCKELKYFANDNRPTTSKTIEVQNIGIIPAKFRFDIKNNAAGCFNVNVMGGVIQPGKYKYVTIAFKPKNYGVYFNDLYLLTLHTKPKRIKLIGYYTKNDVKEDAVTFKMYTVPVNCRTGFNGYLYDVVDVCEKPPPISLSSTSLDFGWVGMKSPDQTRTLVTSLTNNETNSIKVVWEDDPREIFQINPKEVSIPPNNSVLLECTFKPKQPDTFYDTIMNARGFWSKEPNMVVVPLCIHLRFLGSSFPANKSWIPQLSYPTKVIVRPTLPNSVTHDSFELKVTGHLPVSYSFLPPKKSAFILKPCQGVVIDREIIIVQFSSNGLCDKACLERWTLILNGRENQPHYIYFSSYSEIPKLLVNKDNTIRFDNVLPKCQDKKQITLKNTSVHCITFLFLPPDESTIEFNPKEGRLTGNEEMVVECTATPSYDGLCHSKVTVELRKFAISAVTGLPYNVTVDTKIRCIYAELCALPSVIDLGTIRVDERITTKFDLFNFGESKIAFELVVYPDGEGRFKNCVKFSPRKEEMLPGQHLTINTAINCTEGHFEFCVCYLVRIHRDSYKTVPDEPKHVVKIIGDTAYPTLQIVGITDYTHGECFSKAALWKLLNIEKFNNELKVIKKGENRTVEIFLPDCEESDDPFSTTLVLQNQSIFDITVNIKRNKICDCPKISVNKSISFRKNTFDCRHRRLFEATLSKNEFEPDDCNQLTFTINYEREENVTMSYFLQLPEERTLILYFHFKILGSDNESPSKYHIGYTLHLPPVAVIEKDPAYVPLHFYNQSSKTVTVRLNEKRRDQSRYDKGFEIMKCLNSDIAKISPYKTYALLFQFQPIEYKKYTAIFNLVLGKSEHKLSVSSTATPCINPEQTFYDMGDYKITVPEPDITYVTDHVKLRRMLTWSCVETLVFMKNNTDDVIGYSIKKNWIEGVLSMYAHNNKGVLKPREVRAIVIHIDTFDTPLKMNLHLIGKFLNHTQYYRNRRSQLEYNIKQESIKEEFTITEKGEEYPKNDTVVEPMPTNFFRTIMFEFTSISFFDVDLHMDAEEQLKQSPQNLLNLNEKNIVKSLYPRKLKDEDPVPTVAKKMSSRDGSGDQGRDQNCVPPSFENINFLKETLECMLLTAVESKMFKKSLRLHLESDPPYYIQFLVDDEIHYRKANISKMETIRNELNTCQGPDVAVIMRNLLSDGLHQVMRLGAPPGSRSDKVSVYDQKRQSFSM